MTTGAVWTRADPGFHGQTSQRANCLSRKLMWALGEF